MSAFNADVSLFSFHLTIFYEFIMKCSGLNWGPYYCLVMALSMRSSMDCSNFLSLGSSLHHFSLCPSTSAFTPFQVKILWIKAVLKTEGRAVSVIDFSAGVLEEVPCCGTKAWSSLGYFCSLKSLPHSEEGEGSESTEITVRVVFSKYKGSLLGVLWCVLAEFGGAVPRLLLSRENEADIYR